MGRRAHVMLVLVCLVLFRSPASERAAPGTKRVLHFPNDVYVGRLLVEDPCLGSECIEFGRDLSYEFGFDPKCVRLAGDWDFVGLARGDVIVPGEDRLRLEVLLRPLDEDRPRLSALMRHFLSSQVTMGPPDLTGLSQLDPDDLYYLHVGGLVGRSDAGSRVLAPISRLTGLRVLELSQTGMRDCQTQYLKPLQSLRALVLFDEHSLRNAGLAVLKELPTLEYLDLDTATTDVGLKDLAQIPNLRWLRLRTGRIWGRGLRELARAPRLERLCLWGDKGLTDRLVGNLESLTQLKSLTLWGGDSQLTDASLASIGKLTDLEELYFIRVSNTFTDAGIGHLENLRNLRKISFTFCRVGAEGLQHLANLPHLESLEGLAPSADAASVLPTMRNLKTLDVNWFIPPLGTLVPPEVVAATGQLDFLEELAVMGGRWSSEDLRVFGKLTNLKRLRLGMYEDVDDSALTEIGKLKNLEYLAFSGEAVSKRGLNQLNSLTKLRSLDVSIFSLSEKAPGIDETPLDLSALTNLKTLELTGLDLQDADLASVAGMRDLEWLVVASDGLTEASLAYLGDLPELKHLHMSGLTCATGTGLAYLAGLSKAVSISLRGCVTNEALDRLGGLSSLWGLDVETDQIIRPETVAGLKKRLPAIMSIKVQEPMRLNPAPVHLKRSDSRAQRAR